MKCYTCKDDLDSNLYASCKCGFGEITASAQSSVAFFMEKRETIFRSNSFSQSLCRAEKEQSGIEEHGEELQNNGQAAKEAGSIYR